MSYKIKVAFLMLIGLQALHSIEEFVFEFYERFPPMAFLYRDSPHLAKPAFFISNVLLVLFGVFCFFRWVQPASKSAGTILWFWITIESFNVAAHLVWAFFIRDYNPGLATVLLFLPILIYLGYQLQRWNTEP
ncbi:MAG TPA: HXXEE domain-containing protein [Pyrinomonadaceae bacterium]|jgi:hypothetical protein